MNLVWKLLRRHISIPQFVGFFFANLFGMLTVLLGIQFYSDIKPVFTAKDSFMKSDYVILSKKIGLGTTLSARSHNFTPDEISKLQRQTFVDTVGTFTSAEYKVEASMGINGQTILNTELPLESIPDDFIDVAHKRLALHRRQPRGAHHPAALVYQHVQLRLCPVAQPATDQRRTDGTHRPQALHQGHRVQG